MSGYILEMKNITKRFPGVIALKDVNLPVEANTIHTLVGENGAGKSTLMNVLSGIYPYGDYEGEVCYEGELNTFRSIRDSEKKGIVIIHQELALIPHLSIMENIFLGNETANRGIINWHDCRHKALELMETVGLDENPDTPINQIGVGKQQLVEIAKALSKEVKLLILDEPTAALNDDDSEKLLNLILHLRDKEGLTCIIISHKLNEVLKVSDKITILRDGMTIETLDMKTDEITEDRIIQGMVGREITDMYPSRNVPIGDIRFEVKDWNVYHPEVSQRKMVDNVNFNVRKGEVVGIAGLMGAGRTELAMSLFGKSYGSKISGEIFINGNKVELNTVYDAINNKLAYVTEDRKEYGLILIDNIYHNITLPSLNKVSHNGVMDDCAEQAVGNEYMERLSIRAPDIFHKTMSLSGGNQQKVMLSRWIYADPDVLILDEPTRGIDVGAKFEIYTIINQLVEAGKSVVIISSELPEVIGISDRIYIMCEGSFIGEVSGKDATQELIMEHIVQHC